MVIETRRNIISISGALQTNQWHVIRTTAFLVYERFPREVVIDFAGVRWISTDGESTLADAIDEIERCSLPFVLLTVSRTAQLQLSSSVSTRLSAGTERWWNRLCGAD